MGQNTRSALTIDGRLLRPSRASSQSWRSRRRLLSLLPRLAWYTVVLTLLALAGWVGLAALRDAAFFRVRRIEFVGLSQIDPARLQQRLAPLLGRSIFVTDPSAVLQALKREPYLDRVVVRRQLPNRLVVELEERVPAALGLIGGRWKLLDASGVMLGGYGASAPKLALPQVYYLDRRDRARYQAALRAALQAHRELTLAGLEVRALVADQADQVSAYLSDRSYRLLMGSGEARAKVQRYLRLRGEIDGRSEVFDTVDLRFQEQVVLRRMQPADEAHE